MQYGYQHNNWECGVLAIRNALLTLGRDVDRKEIKELARSNSNDGTSKRGIVRAVRSLDFNAIVYQTRSPDYAFRWLYKWSENYPLIVLLDDMNHWATVVGRISGRVILVDPSVTERYDMGVHSLKKKEILSRWVGRGWYYAIRVQGL